MYDGFRKRAGSAMRGAETTRRRNEILPTLLAQPGPNYEETERKLPTLLAQTGPNCGPFLLSFFDIVSDRTLHRTLYADFLQS